MTAPDDAPSSGGVSEKQKHLVMSELREIFQAVGALAGHEPDERVILRHIAERYPQYEMRLLRWLVRHTLHSQTDDDIMPDEVKSQTRRMEEDNLPCLEVEFNFVPPTVRPYFLVQYSQTFWHVIELDEANRRALLRPLATYEV
jgi:hypothetical protein